MGNVAVQSNLPGDYYQCTGGPNYNCQVSEANSGPRFSCKEKNGSYLCGASGLPSFRCQVNHMDGTLDCNELGKTPQTLDGMPYYDTNNGNMYNTNGNQYSNNKYRSIGESSNQQSTQNQNPSTRISDSSRLPAQETPWQQIRQPVTGNDMRTLTPSASPAFTTSTDTWMLAGGIGFILLIIIIVIIALALSSAENNEVEE